MEEKMRKEKCEATITVIETLMKDFDAEETEYIFDKVLEVL